MVKNLNAEIFNRVSIQQAKELIEKSMAITLLTHERPDADGISACAALEIVLNKFGKITETIYPTEPEFPLARQPKKVLIKQHQQKPDLLIICDTASYQRMYYPEAFHQVPSINIDHHISNSIDATINFVSNEVSSASEAVYILLNEWFAGSVDKALAETLLTGILYDTMVFSNQATTSGTLRNVADMIDGGADLFLLEQELLCHKDPQIISFWGTLLAGIKYSPSKKAAWAIISQNDLQSKQLTLTSLVGFTNFLAQLSGIDITVLFYEMNDGSTKVSLRSKKADVNEFANKFGGGGHKNASGIHINRPLEAVVAELTKYFV